MTTDEFRAVILDMDGVITRTARLHARAWKTMFDAFLAERGGASYRPFDSDRDYRRYVDGKPRLDGIKDFLRSRGIELPFGDEADQPDKATVCGLGKRKNTIFHQLLEREGVETYEDTVAQIRNWKRQGLKLAVISSSRNCAAILQAANLLDQFDAKVDGNDLARQGLSGKPAPDMFLHAARLLDVEPSDAIVIEDAIAGVQAGRKGRFGLVVGVARDRGAGDLTQAGADCVVRDLRELETAGQARTSMHPPEPPLSALEHSDQIATRIRGRQLALFLDYDGTLTPIVRRPEQATLSGKMRALLAKLAERCTLAIVSGRDRRNAEQMVQLENLVYAGSHGFDIRGPAGLEMQQEDARRALPELDAAERRIAELIEPIDGAHLERKRFAIAVHYREVESDEGVRQVERAVDDVLAQHPGLRKRGGKKIFELQPDVPWDKGYAVLWLTQALGLRHPGVIVIYIGDDVTDEDAFRALRSHGTGIGIRVAPPTADTDASYYLSDCGAVQRFLETLLVMLDEAQTSGR